MNNHIQINMNEFKTDKCTTNNNLVKKKPLWLFAHANLQLTGNPLNITKRIGN